MYRFRIFILVVMLSIFQGCGYHLRGAGDALPEDVRTLAISNFKNNTYEADMETLISVSLSEEFSRSKRLLMVSETDADLILEGTITSFRNSPVSFSSSDVATDYRLELTIDLTLKRNGGDLMWSDRGVKEMTDYKSVPGNLAITQTNMDEAKSVLAKDMAEFIYEKVFEGF